MQHTVDLTFRGHFLFDKVLLLRYDKYVLLLLFLLLLFYLSKILNERLLLLCSRQFK